ncbi:hypothetical protein [Rhizobium sp. ICMP 5592]|uniref:hypothetical protein n=1 Tax=Rhizobium sp. ICMP 5592 TaxID=2292445 RepID=UPI001296627F|nr:hypothetical protein [Rhizobium sp. ICMP 5592]MQB44845.1 hypothetical protein [Rhizobium sp. ICMP 5592]
MTNRTTQTVVHFPFPFLLPGFDAPQLAGEYRVDRQEEVIEGISWLAWRGVGAFIHLPAIATEGARRQMAPINPADLEIALEKDHKQS